MAGTFTKYQSLSVKELCLKDLKKLARLTTADEQIELSNLFKSMGSIGSRNLLVGTGVYWGLKLTHRFCKRYNCYGYFLDLMQEAMVGLIKAAEYYDPNLGRYSTVATFYIKTALDRFIINHADDLRVPVWRIDSLKKLRIVIVELRKELKREPTDQEIMEKSGFGKKTLETVRSTRVRIRSLSDVVFEGKDGASTTLGDLIPDTRQINELLTSVEGADIQGELVRYIQRRFKPKVASSVIAYYQLDGGMEMTLEEVATRDGVTKQMIFTRVEKVIKDPNFIWFVSKLFRNNGYRVPRPNPSNLTLRLEKQRRLADEVATVPAISNMKQIRHEVQESENEEELKVLAPEDSVLVTKVIKVIEEFYGFPAGHLIGSSRNHQVCYARKVAGQIIRDSTSLSWDEIGKVFNRTGALFNLYSREIREMIREGHTVKDSIADIKSQLGSEVTSKRFNQISQEIFGQTGRS